MAADTPKDSLSEFLEHIQGLNKKPHEFKFEVTYEKRHEICASETSMKFVLASSMKFVPAYSVVKHQIEILPTSLIKRRSFI